MLDYILSLSKQFIAVKSIPEHPLELKRVLDIALDELTEFTIERFESNGVQSALIYNTPQRPDVFPILLNGHLDVIPGKTEQYTPRVEDNKLYGVGAMDMKANVACMIAAFKEVATRVDYPLALQLVTDEEIGGFHGTKFQVDQGVRAEFVLAGEPTNFDIVHQAKGVLWLKIEASGVTAHGAYPWRGDNAIWKMQDFLSKLKNEFPIPENEVWESTLNLSTISTNNTVSNKIPDSCVIQLDIRFVPEDSESILQRVQAILPDGLHVEVIANEPALFTEKSNEYIEKISSIGKETLERNIMLRGANGTSDARHFARVGGKGIEFGPIGEGIGSDNEWVDIESLEKFYTILVNLLLSVK